MWAIENTTRFEADRSFVRDVNGAEIFLVAVRATFDFDKKGNLKIADEQIPVANAPVWLGKPGASSLRWDTDLQRTKLGTDVILNGSAYAPYGQPAEMVETSMKVGPIQKKLEVTGDRIQKGHAFESKPFTRMPIVYERALGGESSDHNPIGVGLSGGQSQRFPNVAGGGKVAGYGALSCSWKPRRDFAGTYDSRWERKRKPLLPEDFNDRYYYAAPADQQVPGFLKGGERVELTNLTPEGQVRFKLPRLRFGCTTFIDGGRTHHRTDLHSVIIEPDERKLVMVWHSQLPCHHTIYTLKKCVVFEKENSSSSEQVA